MEFPRLLRLTLIKIGCGVLPTGTTIYQYMQIDDGTVDRMTARGLANAPSRILAAIAEVFETDIYTEHELQYWGFDTEEEWEAYQDALAEEDQAKTYASIVNYLNGESQDIKTGTIGECWAEIANDLVTNDPLLLDSKNQNKLMGMVDEIYNKEHAVIITLTDEDLALAKLAATHEEDLPQA